jgi:hypothetical protein
MPVRNTLHSGGSLDYNDASLEVRAGGAILIKKAGATAHQNKLAPGLTRKRSQLDRRSARNQRDDGWLPPCRARASRIEEASLSPDDVHFPSSHLPDVP